MKSIVGFLLVLLAVMPGLAQPPVEKPKAAENVPVYYPIEVGTKWHYQVDDGNGRKGQVMTRIAAVEKTGETSIARLETIVNDAIRGTEHVGIQNQGVFRYRQNEVEVSPPICLLKYPIKKDETWKKESKVGDQKLTATGRQGGIETVQVPAGKFQAVSAKIAINVDGKTFTTTYWFAPDVGIIKELVEVPGQTIHLELTRFEAGKRTATGAAR